MENAEHGGHGGHGGQSVNTEGIQHDATPVYPEARPDGYFEDLMSPHSGLHITADTTGEQNAMMNEHADFAL